MKSIGKIDTQTLLIIGGAGIAIYLFMNKKPTYTAVPLPTQTAYQMQQAQLGQGNSTGAIISSAGTAAGAILNGLSNFF